MRNRNLWLLMFVSKSVGFHHLWNIFILNILLDVSLICLCIYDRLCNVNAVTFTFESAVDFVELNMYF